MISRLENEIIALNANTSLIGDIVNHSILTKSEGDENITLLPNTAVHQKFFNILLVEYLSRPPKEVERMLGLKHPPQSDKDHGYLFYLQEVCSNPLLNPDGTKQLLSPVQDFISWLDKECVVEGVWFPSINTQVNLKLPRVSFIKICGDISKHGFPRLNERVKGVQEILSKNRVKITTDQAYLVLPEFYEWFHSDIFNYHASAIVEFLNNIGWAIYEYLSPIRQNNTLDKDLGTVARSMYYDLKSFRPYMPKFTVTKYLKMRY